MALNIEEIDLAVVSSALERMFVGSPPEGYVRGRTAIRDALAQHLRCDEAEAERLVETMLGRGFLRFNGDPGIAAESGEIWIIRSEDGTEERRDPSQRPKP